METAEAATEVGYPAKVNFFHRSDVDQGVKAEARRRGVRPSEVWREASERGLAAMARETVPAERDAA